MAERKGRRKGIEPPRGHTVSESIGYDSNRRSDLRSVTSPEERHHLISTAAYFRAERRGFQPGSELEDWLQAEAEIDRRFNSQGSPSPEV